MDTLLAKMVEMTEADIQVVDNFNLEWDSREAIRQANKIAKVFGEPTYVNTSPGGSMNWFDLGKPMPFSQITVEDAPPYGFLQGKKSYSSFTILMRLTKAFVDIPFDLATYNHNNGKLICHAQSWKEAVVIAVAVNMKDSGGLESVSEMWKAWRKTKDVTDFVTYLIGEDDEDNSIQLDDEEDEDEPSSPVPILIEKKEEVAKKSTPSVTITKEGPSPVPSNVITTSSNKPNIKSPGGKPRGKARVSSPPRSPVRTIGTKGNKLPSFLKK